MNNKFLRFVTSLLMTPDNRTILLKKIKKSGFPKNEVFVSVKDFFEGNNDLGSIGANIYPDHPGLKTFYDKLKAIEEDSKTQAVLIRIADIDDTEWFYSDTVYIAGDYTVKEVKKLFKELKPDEVYEGKMFDKPSNIPVTSPGNKEYSVWWD